MIFVTVGTQKPFDRLIRLADAWAAKHAGLDVYAQTCGGEYEPKKLQHCAFLSGKRVNEFSSNARLIVSHAGMGSILTARLYRKPIVIIPRRHMLGEHRNDHQIDTASKLEGRHGIYVCWRDTDFDETVEAALAHSVEAHLEPAYNPVSDFVDKIARWIES